MRRWTIGACLLLGVILSSAISSSAQSQEPSVQGNWNITFFGEPNHPQGATQCVVFTVNPGSVLGEPLGGQWTCTTFPRWSGDWFQEGEHVQWYGSTSGGLATSEYGDLASSDLSQGKFNHFFPGSPGSRTSTGGAWTGTRVQSCPPSSSAAARATSQESDPAQ